MPPSLLRQPEEEEEEARWVKHKGKQAVRGFNAHIGTDADTALVEEVSITSANINDGKAGPDALPENPGEVFADSAYRGYHFRDAVRAKGSIPRIVATGMWGHDEAEPLRELHEWKQPNHRVGGRIEKIFGTWKRCYGLRRMRWRGLAKAAVQVHLTAIAYNLKRTMNILYVPA
ncbi:transposase [Sphingobium chungbukense]|uniref:transposase n=1 Tax=Sphingobium chungbukense TaxID=56193 RepID=UPI000B2CD1A3|nr:transposase [Sphingobium chungbukense]